MSPASQRSGQLYSAIKPTYHAFHYQLPIVTPQRLHTATRTSPSTEYLEAVNTPSTLLDADQLAVRKKQLLILDLNGTLLSRTKRRTGMYVRPHLESFLDYVFIHFRVMVWSSAQPSSVKQMMQCFGQTQKSKLALAWNRSHFGLSPADYNNKAATLKDLNRVWEKKGFGHFDASNTVILDDSPSKCALQPYNSIHLPTFDHKDPGFLDQGDQVLLSVMDYLKRIQQQTNIPNFIRQVPFTPTVMDSSVLDKSCVYYSFTHPGDPLTCDFSVEQPTSRT